MAETQVAFNDADAYERYMGRWSRAVGQNFLAWLTPPKNAKWLDVGCGTGAFSELILKTCAPASVIGVDPAPAQIELAKKQATAGKADFRVADAMALPFGDNEFDVVVSALVLHFLPDRGKGLREMLRVVRPGGIVAGYTWERTEASDFAPYHALAQGLGSMGAYATRSPLVPEASVEGLKATLENTGFADIVVTRIEGTEGYRDFDDYWEAQTPPFAPVGKSVRALSDDKRNELRERMRKTMTAGLDGSIRYSARATSFKATKRR